MKKLKLFFWLIALLSGTSFFTAFYYLIICNNTLYGAAFVFIGALLTVAEYILFYQMIKKI